MKAPKPLRKIIWAIDVFEDEACIAVPSRVLRALSSAAAHPGLTIHPVTLFHSSSGSLSPVRRRLACGNLVTEVIAKRLKAVAEHCGVAGIEAGTILTVESGEFSHRRSANLLAEFAHEVGADAILVATHARRDAPRLFLGSFAEALLLASPVPVITVNHRTRVPKRLSHILFPTDFSQASRRGYEHAVGLTAVLGGRLTLFHKLPTRPDAPELENTPWVLERLAAESEHRCRRLAAAWGDWAAARRVPVEVVINREPGDLAPALIAYAASHEVDLVSMVGRTTPMPSLLVGNFTRQTLRRVSCPVWIQHPLPHPSLRRASV